MATQEKDFGFTILVTGDNPTNNIKLIKQFAGSGAQLDVLGELKYASKEVFVAQKHVKLNIRNAPAPRTTRRRGYIMGQDLFSKAQGVMILYDLNESDNVRTIASDLKEMFVGEAILVGSSNFENSPEHLVADGKKISEDFGMDFIAVCLNSVFTIEKAFTKLTSAILKKEGSGLSSFDWSWAFDDSTSVNSAVIDAFGDAMKNGVEKVFEIRTMVAGHQGVGKTTLTMGLLQDDRPPDDIKSTEGIEIYIGWSDVDLETKCWIPRSGKHFEEMTRKLAEFVRSIEYSMLIARTKPTDNTPETKRPQKNKLFSKPCLPKKPGKKMQTSSDDQLLKSTAESNTPESLFKKGVENAADEIPKGAAPVQIWDFGGHVVFYTTHQTFLSSRFIYLLVFDISRNLQDTVNDLHLIPGSYTDPKVIEFLFFWVNSIITYAGGKYPGFPKIIFIGTHIDKIPVERREQRAKMVFREIDGQFKEHIGYNHLIIDSDLCLNARDSKSDVYDKIRKKITETAEVQPFWGEKRPTAWLSLEAVLTNLRQTGMKILSLVQIYALNKWNQVIKMEQKEVDAFLQFQHLQGNLLFFPEESLRQYIILNPAWLIDGLKSFITAEEFCQDDARKNMWRKTSKHGLLPYSSIKELWEKVENREFLVHKDHILRTMERLDLLAKPKTYSKEGEISDAEYYLIPCMINRELSLDEEKRIIPRGRAVCMLIIFAGRFLPPAIFHRLVATCLTMWPLIDQQEDKLLYTGFCGLRLDNFHRLFLMQKKHDLVIYVSHTRDVQAISSILCRGITQFIMSALERITDVYNQYHLDAEGDNVKKPVKKCLFEIMFPCCVNHIDCIISNTRSDKIDYSKCVHHHSRQSNTWPLFENKDEPSLHCSCHHGCTGLDPEILRRPPQNADLSRLSRVLLSSPDILGAALEVPREEVDGIKHSTFYGKHAENFRILKYWRDNRKSSLNALLEGLSISEDADPHIMCKAYKAKTQFHDSDFLSYSNLEEPSTEKLDALADRLAPTQAFFLGIELGFDDADLEKIRHDNLNNSLQQIRQMLHQWRDKSRDKSQDKSREKPTYIALQIALSAVGVADRVLKEVLEGPCTDDEI